MSKDVTVNIKITFWLNYVPTSGWRIYPSPISQFLIVTVGLHLGRLLACCNVLKEVTHRVLYVSEQRQKEKWQKCHISCIQKLDSWDNEAFLGHLSKWGSSPHKSSNLYLTQISIVTAVVAWRNNSAVSWDREDKSLLSELEETTGEKLF